MSPLLHRLRQTAQRVGLDVRRFRPHPWRPLGLATEVKTILDVGAADGTPDLYEAYPSANIVAIDPIGEQLARLRENLAGRSAEYIEAAVGDREGTVELHIDRANILKSSVSSRTALTASDGGSDRRMVPMRPLDDLVAEHNWLTPFALKIDTEGHEVAVLSGAERTLSDCAVVYCETSVAARFENGYQFSDVAGRMLELGFELVDVIDAPIGRDGRTLFLDCVWLRSPAAAPEP
jgi:FkbM family methyltransferase